MVPARNWDFDRNPNKIYNPTKIGLLAVLIRFIDLWLLIFKKHGGERLNEKASIQCIRKPQSQYFLVTKRMIATEYKKPFCLGCK